MRNLKRALSLALASIMLLGMMVTGAGAASNSFTDFDQIVNQEAAEVTSGLGIFDGYTDGSFGPEKVVTRAEMAVIICKLLNGSDVDPGNFTGISKFTDVPAWAEGYVNYCAASGIVVGVGEGKFNPSATVTTVEAATMLLKALGYFTEEDKLKEDWKTVVTGRATGMKLYGTLTLAVDEGLTRDNVAELVFNTLFAQRVAYDDNRQLYVKNTNRDVVVTNGTQDYLNTFAENTFHMWVVDGLVTANSFTHDDLSETTNNAPRTNVIFDTADAQDYPATAYQGSTGSEYPFEYTTGLDMIGHAARVYYRMERNAPVVFAIADRATKVEYITYDANETNLSNAANAAGFRRNTIRQISEDDYKVNYAWDVTVGTLKRDSSDDNNVDLTGDKSIDPAKTLLVISNSSDNAVDYVIVLDQYLDTVKRVVTKNDVTEYDLTTIDGVEQNILHGNAAQGDYVVVTDIGKQGDMLNFELAEKVSANITKITGKSDANATVKSIVADGTTYVGSPVYDHRVTNNALENTTDFEDIATIGEATLLLDFQGKCIGLAQPESTPNYAYAAQFGVWHTGGSLNTEFKLTVKLYFLDGTSGVYLVNTDASESSNTFYGLKLGVDETVAENYRDILNGGANKKYDVLKTYNPKIDVGTGNAGEGTKGVIYLNGWGNENTDDVSGLGIYKATVRADDTVVLKALGDHDAVAATYGDQTKIIPGHSTLVKANGQNLTCPEGTGNNVLFQNNKTVYFYVSGTYDDLSVGAKYGVANAVAITNSTHMKTNALGIANPAKVETNDKDNNGENDTIVQILTGSGGRKHEEAKETVEAVLVWGYDLGSSDTMYFYRQNSYDIEHKDNASSRAGEKLYTITYHMFTMDGEPYEAHFDNGGKYYDMETAKETVSSKPTGFYTLGSKDINKKWASNETDKIYYVKNNVDIGTTDGAKNVYVLNAVAKHDTYVDNLYTHVEDVGGIIPSTAKVVSTVDNCTFDSINEIARACDNGALVKISYTYSTSDYKVKTVFITEYNKNGGTIANAGADLWSYYSAPWLYVFNNVEKPASYIEVANSAKAALEKAGFTVTNMQPAGMTQNGNVYWTIEATMGNTRYNFTNGPTGMGFGTNGFNYYVNIVQETIRVQINGNLATNGGVVKEGYCLPESTIKVSDKTVATGNLYDTLVNNGKTYESVKATNSQIVYTLPASIEAGYTVNFKSTTAVKPEKGVVTLALSDGYTVQSITKDGATEPVKDNKITEIGEYTVVVAIAEPKENTTYTVEIDGGKLEGILPSEDGKTFAFTYELISLPAEGAVENVKITAVTTEPEKGKVTLSTNLGEIAPAEITAAGETSVTITVTPEAGKAYSVTYEGTKYEADENGVITIPVTVSEEQITNGAAIAFTVVTEDTGDGVNLTAPEGYTILSGGKITAAGEQTARVKIDAFAVDTAYAVTVNGETVVPTLYLGSKELVVTYTLDEMPAEDVVMEIKTITNFFDMGDGYGKLTTTGVDYICYYVEGTPSRAGVPGGVTTKTDGSYWNFTFKNGDVTIDMPFVVSGTKLLFREALPQDVVDKANNTPGVFRASGKPEAVSTISFEDGDVTAAVDETTGKIEEINFKLGAPKAEGALLPETIVLDGNVEATIVWKDADGNVVTGETAVAPLGQYTYEATLKAAASTEATFADTVKVTTQKGGAGVNVPNFAEDGAEVKEDGTVVTAPTPIEAITVNVSGKLSANAVPSFEIPTSEDYKSEISKKSPNDASVMAGTTYTWTVTITSRENKNVKLSADTKIEFDFGTTGLTEEDVVVGPIDAEKGTFTVSVTTKRAATANNGTKQVKVDNNGAVTFYAYKGPEGTDEVTPMDAVEIAEAISALDTGYGDMIVNWKNVTINGDNSSAITDKGQKLTFKESGSTGGELNNPKPLYKVTKPDGTVTYVAADGKLTGLGDLKAIMTSDKFVAKAQNDGAYAVTQATATDVNGGTVTFSTLNADTVFVEALGLHTLANGEIKIAAPVTSRANDTTVATVKVVPAEGQTEVALNAGSNSYEYIARGTNVKIEFVTTPLTALAGQDIEFKVNGEVVATGKYDAKGVLTLDGEDAGKKFITVKIDSVDAVAKDNAGKGKVTFTATSGLVVTLNGKVLEPNTEGKYNVGEPEGMVIVSTTTTKNSDGTTSVEYAPITATSGVYEASADDKDALDGVIRLVTAFEVKLTESDLDFELYTAYDGKELKDADKVVAVAGGRADGDDTKYIAVGADGTANVWVKAAKMNTEILPRDETITMTVTNSTPTMFRNGIWEATVSKNVNQDSFEAGMSLNYDKINPAITATHTGELKAGTSGDFTTAASLGDTGATVTSIVWVGDNTKFSDVVTAKINEEGKLVITASAGEEDISADEQNRADVSLATVRVYLKTSTGLEMETDMGLVVTAANS